MRNDRITRFILRYLNLLYKGLVRVSLLTVEMYPIIFTVIVCWKRFTDNFSTFFDVLISKDLSFSNYEPDYIVASIGSAVIISGAVKVINTEIQDKKNKEHLRQIITGSPNSDALKSSASLFNSCLLLVRGFQVVEKETDLKKDIKPIEVILYGFSDLLRKISAKYFKISENEININFMIFLEADILKSDGYKKYESDKSVKNIYIRDNVKDEDFVGGLLLVEELYFSKKNTFSNHIFIPVYKPSSRIYNSEDNFEDLPIPGAPAAYHNNYHVIANTRRKNNYEKFNSLTRDQILEYFLTTAKNIRSVISFRILDDRSQTVGILNIDSERTSAFEFDEMDYSAFHGLIYPSLKMTDRYLDTYKQYLISRFE